MTTKAFIGSGYSNYGEWLKDVRKNGKCLQCGKRPAVWAGPICEKCNAENTEELYK